MCGIAGVFNFRTEVPPDQAAVSRMAKVMAHRGPDADGFYFDGALALAHRIRQHRVDAQRSEEERGARECAEYRKDEPPRRDGSIDDGLQRLVLPNRQGGVRRIQRPLDALRERDGRQS